MEGKRTVQGVARRIAAFSRENRRMPTYAEMVDLLGVRSKSVVDFWIRKLVAEGLLEKDARGFLRPCMRSLALPMVGDVQAGFPSPAEEELRDLISLDEYLVTRPDSSFLLKVSGDSMEGEGIKEGDLVIVERGREPKNGDIILAEVDGAWTMKYFRKKGKEVVLEAANPRYPVIRPHAELKVGGVITAVIRKYQI
ncbi:MAG: LexA repressor [Syntrophaceae bacterium PtaU1.Bin231]|nr:MAG: LexA repressor [Syntrophaceae bacterium PtaU1.Bin231]HOG16955.1 transcriptional repressor LexA [Syntrophales bacterium]